MEALFGSPFRPINDTVYEITTVIHRITPWMDGSAFSMFSSPLCEQRHIRCATLHLSGPLCGSEGELCSWRAIFNHWWQRLCCFKRCRQRGDGARGGPQTENGAFVVTAGRLGVSSRQRGRWLQLGCSLQFFRVHINHNTSWRWTRIQTKDECSFFMFVFFRIVYVPLCMIYLNLLFFLWGFLPKGE